MPASPLAIEWVPIKRLSLNPANPRHNDEAVPHVLASLRRFGWQQPIVARPSGEVIAGNTRLKAALEMGQDHVPVVWFQGTDLDAAAYGIADNRTSEFATWDEPALGAILEALRAEDGLEGVGYSDAEITELLARLDAESRGAEEFDDPGPEDPPEQPVTHPGDLWLLGGHRLLCGDSTKPESLERLMVGEKATLFATDGPYLVGYTGANHPADHHKKAGRKAAPGKEVGNRHWDEYIDPESSVEFFRSYLAAGLAHCIDRVPVYGWHASRRQALFEQAWKDNGLLVHQTIIWTKTRPVLTRSHFLWQHEPCFYGWREGFMPEKDRRPPTTATTVWPIDQAGEPKGLHPTLKPVEVFERPIGWHTKPGEVCLETFSGGGTQIISAEKLGRRCFALELSPAFVDVAVRRWEQATSKEAILEGTGQTFAEVAQERGLGVRP